MRKFTALYFVFLAVITLSLIGNVKSTSQKMDKVTLYFADRQMMRLVPSDYYINAADTETEINAVIDELLQGRDYIQSIRRLLPTSKDAISAHFSGETAYIDINCEYMSFYESGRDLEELIVYQLVNSVSSVKGVSRVKFLFDGEVRKDFLYRIDMREAFVPDYYV